MAATVVGQRQDRDIRWDSRRRQKYGYGDKSYLTGQKMTLHSTATAPAVAPSTLQATPSKSMATGLETRMAAQTVAKALVGDVAGYMDGAARQAHKQLVDTLSKSGAHAKIDGKYELSNEAVGALARFGNATSNEFVYAEIKDQVTPNTMAKFGEALSMDATLDTHSL